MATDAYAPEIRDLPLVSTDGFDLLRRPVWILDTVRMRKYYANAAALKLWRVPADGLDEFFIRDFTPHSTAIRERLAGTLGRVANGEVLVERWTFYPKGGAFTVDCTQSGVRLPNGNVGMLVEAAVPEVAPEELRGVEALRHTAVMVTLYSANGAVLFRNPAATRAYPNPSHAFLASFVDPGEGERFWRAALGHEVARTDAFMGQATTGEFRAVTSLGVRWHGLYLCTTTDPVTGQLCLLVNERDVTDRVQANAHAEYLAGHDVVTALVNRIGFNRRLDGLMETPLSSGGLLVIDLDGFKQINDTHGHGAGDVVLREVGKRLAANARAGDVCARLGGDEFAMILPGLTDPNVLRRRAEQIYHQIIQPIEAPSTGAALTVAASFGTAAWPENGATPDELQRNADLALYAAKGESGQRIKHFDMDMRRVADERHKCIEDLRAGLERGEFEVYFQPLVGFAEPRPIGFEALLRWRHPERGLVLPGEFVGAAESVGLMAPIGRFVLEAAVRQMRLWLDMGFDVRRLAINLSSNQLHIRNLAELARDAVASAGVPAALVEFEVPETVTLGRGGEGAVGALWDLRRLGFAIALDDFGTGYASLTHLRRLPVDTIKLDRSFIVDMNASVADRAIVRALIGLGHDLGLQVLAEGIETHEQFAAVAELGCDAGQGFLFGYPMPAGEATDWLRANAQIADRRKVISFPG
ncbi:EAL domain-containing protein [Ancylobacter sp. A5.8]|uniref:putative bifunctional diguanylate cyclase/phosphodiesterase n=1 Tax=Ancylobacter gelatini TaxID=2919920 RepID=UPI001F4D8953|nr:EAL domain-containing protein [Ancylobacter gelatini]MCJ8142482.1 EAL domain-containing protein [Ancylobacter gelatini]